MWFIEAMPQRKHRTGDITHWKIIALHSKYAQDTVTQSRFALFLPFHRLHLHALFESAEQPFAVRAEFLVFNKAISFSIAQMHSSFCAIIFSLHKYALSLALLDIKTVTLSLKLRANSYTR